MEELDYDDPAVEREWLEAQQDNLRWYLGKEHVDHGDDFEAAWHLAPYVSLWVGVDPGSPGCLWVISGDLPTDYFRLSAGATARDAMRAFASRWIEVSEVMLTGKTHAEIAIGKSESPEGRKELGDLLRRRACILKEWADDDSMW